MNKLFNYIKSLFTKSHEEEILAICGNVCYCPDCLQPLNDQEGEYIDQDEFAYTCTCGYVSVFNFGIAPVPILTDNYKVLTSTDFATKNEDYSCIMKYRKEKDGTITVLSTEYQKPFKEV